MLVTLNWIEKNYNKYNNLYWNGKLPKINFKISRSKKTWGYASYRYNFSANTVTPLAITISNYYDSPEDVKLTTLLHEMIHIADYTFNPQHFVQNHRKVSKRYYDAHGFWFKGEAARLKKFGWDIEKYVTAEEKAVSTLSDNEKRLINHKVDTGLVCVIYGKNGISWMIKTSTYYVKDILFSIRRCYWTEIGGIKDIKFYSFDDVALASKRSCGKNIRGWRCSTPELMKDKLKSIKAKENKNYKTEIHNIVMKLVA